MKELLDTLWFMVNEFGSAPKIEEMLKKTLTDKGINGPTAAHFIEEIHTPHNLAYVTFTTGSSAFQNVVGVTHAEIEGRIKASSRALNLAKVKKGSRILFTYPPLVNVFPKQALDEYDLQWFFLPRSSRDAFLATLCRENPDVIIGESSFIRASLEDAKQMGIYNHLPKEKIVLVAGTPLDLDLLPIAEQLNYSVHDLYGCQEFGWLTIDGIPLRQDISLLELPNMNGTQAELVVGGLPTGDSFVISETGHVCNSKGKIITYRRKRTYPEYEVFVKATTLSSADTIEKVARTILRIKARIIKVDLDLSTSAKQTILELRPGIGEVKESPFIIEGPEKTSLFDTMVKAQLDYQQTNKSDPTWVKKR